MHFNTTVLPPARKKNALPKGVKDVTKAFTGRVNREGAGDPPRYFLNIPAWNSTRKRDNCTQSEAEFLKNLQHSVLEGYAGASKNSADNTYAYQCQHKAEHNYYQYDRYVISDSYNGDLEEGQYNGQVNTFVKPLAVDEYLYKPLPDDMTSYVKIGDDETIVGHGAFKREKGQFVFSTGANGNDNMVYLHRFAANGLSEKTYAIDLSMVEDCDVADLVSLVVPPRA